ncbi:hypothetical protein TWF718_000952 [Orbilia javanica]|uniref:Uncharacterized protein n=1 Tax=Orbilia javanica TaxID=47235 RepID=A0AAN8ND61_9PEZI
MSHHPSDNAHPHQPSQSLNFTLPASATASTDPFHFGGFPGQQQRLSDPPSRESVGNDGHQGKRIFRPNPLLQRPEDAREKRQHLLLRKLQTQRENRAMQSRGGEDEMLRLIYLSEKNRWESSQERAALAISSWKLPAGDDYDMLHAMDTSPAGHQDTDMTMVELMADSEEQELQETISQYQSPDSAPGRHRICPGCGSDEILESSTEAVCFNCGISIDR